MPASVTLEVAGKTLGKSRWASSIASGQRNFRLGTAQSYTLTATSFPAVRRRRKQIGPFRVSTLPARGQPFRFVAMGDSRTYPKDWARVANAVLQKNPALVLFSGDMVADGREDRQWDADFFGVVKTVLCFDSNFLRGRQP